MYSIRNPKPVLTNACSRSPIRQETTDSRSVQCGFESLREYQFKQFIARVAQLEEAADLRSAL
jgi:hypothetical protein